MVLRVTALCTVPSPFNVDSLSFDLEEVTEINCVARGMLNKLPELNILSNLASLYSAGTVAIICSIIDHVDKGMSKLPVKPFYSLIMNHMFNQLLTLIL